MNRLSSLQYGPTRCSLSGCRSGLQDVQIEGNQLHLATSTTQAQHKHNPLCKLVFLLLNRRIETLFAAEHRIGIASRPNTATNKNDEKNTLTPKATVYFLRAQCYPTSWLVLHQIDRCVVISNLRDGLVP